MKKTKKILSLLTALTITASAFSAMVIPAHAAAQVYINESFTEADGQIIKSAGNDVTAAPDPVTKGNIVYAAGRRGNGSMNCSASIASNELAISSDGFATADRGISFTYTGVDIPKVSALEDGEILETSMKIKATQGFTISGFGDIAKDDLATTTDYVLLRAIFDKAANKKYLIVTNAAGTSVLNSKVEALASTDVTFTGMTFYIGSGAHNIDDLKVEVKAKDVGLAALTVKDGNDAALNGATIKIGDDATFTLGDSANTLELALPAGTYAYTASKDGYEATAGQGDNATGSINVTTAGVSEDITLRQMSYEKVPTTATLSGGAAFVKPGDSSAAFTASVIDQKNVAMTSEEYTGAWAVYPTGTTEANDKVTIADGVVTVNESFALNDADFAVYDVVFTASKNTDKAEAKTTIKVANSDVYFIAPQDYAMTGRNQTFTINGTGGVSVDKENGTRISFDFIPGNIGSDGAANATMVFQNSSSKVFGLQVNSDGLYAFTTNSITSDANQSADKNAFTKSVLLGKDNLTSSHHIELNILGSNLIIKYDGGDFAVPFGEEDVAKLYYIKMGNYRESGTSMAAKNLIFSNKLNVNEDLVVVEGDEEFAKITGKTVTRDYTAEALIKADGETFTWSITKADGSAAGAGISIADGVLSVTDDATEGDYKIKAASTVGGTVSETKVGELEVTIADVQTYTADVTYPLAVEKGKDGQFTVNKITDALGDDVTEYFTPAWSIDGAPDADASLDYTDLTPGEATAIFAAYEDDKLAKVTSQTVTVENDGTLSLAAPSGAKVYIWNSLSGMKPISAEVKDAPVTELEDTDLAAIGSKSGKLITNENADSDIVSVTLTIDSENTEDYDVTVGYFSKVVDYNEQTAIAIDDLVEDDAITGYLVTVADADGNKLGEQITAAADIASGAALPATLASGTPAKVEVAPIYALSESIPKTTVRGEFALPTDTYNFTVTLASGSNRTDVYANDQLLVNNMFQYGSTPDTETIHDIYVDGGRITVKTDDYGDGKSANDVTMTAFTAVKAPSIVTRVPKIYVLGDSLVCKYYNGGKTKDASADDKLKQTGWGQVLQNYITDDYEVVDIANSGVTAAGLVNTAFTQVVESAKPGDIVLLESGYNDDEHSTDAEMREALRTMAARNPAGVDLIMISPNASMHDFKESVKKTGIMKEIADETGCKYINLSKLSNDFLEARYDKDTFCKDGDPNTSGSQVNEMSKIWNVSDRLHSTLNAAYKWASVVATEMGKLGYSDIIDTDFTYTFNDVTSLNDLAVGTTGTVTCQATVGSN